MPSTPEEKKKVLTRVRRIRGQIDALERALERALENGAECRSILQQIAAVRGAANGLMAEVLESHIRETFDQNDSYSHEISKSVDDTIELVRAYLK
ncbi:formaldehyde-responsive transcriptional repressor FrmR [Escherichia coli]|uniref:formaldehyde-responsive transcriptional repressor FrmR n=1 Tax=Escherichia coli TaxID=562 RepID=UPI001C7DDD7F|nr:formaldehyde-responsive transcriptional repressor FrmR [Escherichia coli]